MRRSLRASTLLVMAVPAGALAAPRPQLVVVHDRDAALGDVATITVTPGGSALLHDDGRTPDVTRGDGLLAGVVNVDDAGEVRIVVEQGGTSETLVTTLPRAGTNLQLRLSRARGLRVEEGDDPMRPNDVEAPWWSNTRVVVPMTTAPSLWSRVGDTVVRALAGALVGMVVLVGLRLRGGAGE